MNNWITKRKLGMFYERKNLRKCPRDLRRSLNRLVQSCCFQSFGIVDTNEVVLLGLSSREEFSSEAASLLNNEECSGIFLVVFIDVVSNNDNERFAKYDVV
jgi:hypothetical protein